MSNRDWKAAFGPTPEAFKQRVSFTLRKVKEEKPVKKIKMATVVAMAMIVLLLAAVAYAASTQWGLFSFMEYRYDKQMPPEAKDAIQTNIPQTGGDETDVVFKVREALYDGATLHVIIEARPKAAGKVLLMAFDEMPGDLVSNNGPVYEGDERTFKQVAAEEEKSLMRIGLGLKVNDSHVDGSADCLAEEDGTLVIRLSGSLAAQGDTIPLVCDYSVNKLIDGKTTDKLIKGQFTFDLPVNVHKTQRQYSGPVAVVKTGVMVDKIILTKTDAGIYSELTYSISPNATEADAALARGGLWFEYLDEKGQLIEMGTDTVGGGIVGVTLPDGTKSDTQFVQAISLDLKELPDSVTVRGYDCWEKTRFGQHTFTADK